MDGWMDGWIAEQLDGWMDGWLADWLMNGWMDNLFFAFTVQH